VAIVPKRANGQTRDDPSWLFSGWDQCLCNFRLTGYLCEVRAGQYWRLENLKSFDEFLARRFPESRRKAYYLTSIHEHLPPQARKDLKEIGWTREGVGRGNVIACNRTLASEEIVDVVEVQILIIRLQ